jgi:hypothetical protein
VDDDNYDRIRAIQSLSLNWSELVFALAQDPPDIRALIYKRMEDEGWAVPLIRLIREDVEDLVDQQGEQND